MHDQACGSGFLGKIWDSYYTAFTHGHVGVCIFISMLTLKAARNIVGAKKQIKNSIIPYNPIFVKIHTYVYKKNSVRIN